jgi:hypothetical protein
MNGFLIVRSNQPVTADHASPRIHQRVDSCENLTQFSATPWTIGFNISADFS